MHYTVRIIAHSSVKEAYLESILACNGRETIDNTCLKTGRAETKSLLSSSLNVPFPDGPRSHGESTVKVDLVVGTGPGASTKGSSVGDRGTGRTGAKTVGRVEDRIGKVGARGQARGDGTLSGRGSIGRVGECVGGGAGSKSELGVEGNVLNGQLRRRRSDTKISAYLESKVTTDTGRGSAIDGSVGRDVL